jgi:phosphate-selective porin OprO and OprP
MRSFWYGPILVVVLVTIGVTSPLRAQSAGNTMSPTTSQPATITNADLLDELRKLKAEVAETRQLKDQVTQLQNEVYQLRSSGVAPANRDFSTVVGGEVPAPSGPPEPSSPAMRGETMTSHTLDTGGSRNDTLTDMLPLQFRYRYQSTAEGPIAGGTYLQISDPNEEFVLKFQNQVMADSTNFDRLHMPTTEQGWNIPFGRTGIWGNVTKNFGYQVCLQYFLGDINLLDMFGTYQWSKFKIRFGKGLSPVLYEYYAFDPDFEPVITNSMSFQLANKRPIGATFIMNGTFLQLWAGVANNLVSGYYDVTRNPQFVSAATLTPFKETDSIFKHLGGGVGYSVGYENYNLYDASAIGPNHLEQTTNDSWVTSSGVPFAVYNRNVSSVGQRTRVAPHLFWYGRFSLATEYINHSRELSDGATTARSTQNAFMVMASYYLTGERDYGGNGIQGFSSVEPIRPFLPARDQWGPGAWQVAAQWSQFNVGRADFNHGFIDPTRYASQAQQVMAGVNWWPVKNTRLSFDWVWTGFNTPIPFTGGNPIGTFNTFWFRYAMYF